MPLTLHVDGGANDEKGAVTLFTLDFRSFLSFRFSSLGKTVIYIAILIARPPCLVSLPNQLKVSFRRYTNIISPTIVVLCWHILPGCIMYLSPTVVLSCKSSTGSPMLLWNHLIKYKRLPEFIVTSHHHIDTVSIIIL